MKYPARWLRVPPELSFKRRKGFTPPWIGYLAEEGASFLIAHTLPRKGPSTSILRKLGFSRVGTIDHPEDGPVWKWREQEIKIVE
jgi:hypothetical protein